MKRIKQLSGSRLAIAITAVIVTTMVVAGGLAGALPGTRSVFTDDINTGAVNSRTIKNNNIKSKDIKNETIKSKDIRDRTITEDDLAFEVLELLAEEPPAPVVTEMGDGDGFSLWIACEDDAFWGKFDADASGASALAFDGPSGASTIADTGRFSPGVYYVQFIGTFDITLCSWTGNLIDLDFPGDGLMSVRMMSIEEAGANSLIIRTFI